MGCERTMGTEGLIIMQFSHCLKFNPSVPFLDCKIEILEKSKKGEFISGSMIAFVTDLNKTWVLPGSVRCF